METLESYTKPLPLLDHTGLLATMSSGVFDQWLILPYFINSRGIMFASGLTQQLATSCHKVVSRCNFCQITNYFRNDFAICTVIFQSKRDFNVKFLQKKSVDYQQNYNNRNFPSLDTRTRAPEQPSDQLPLSLKAAQGLPM